MLEKMVIEVEYDPAETAGGNNDIEWSVRDAAFHVTGVQRVTQMIYNGEGGFDADPSTTITNIEECSWCRGQGGYGTCSACRGVGYKELDTPRDAAKSDTV